MNKTQMEDFCVDSGDIIIDKRTVKIPKWTAVHPLEEYKKAASKTKIKPETGNPEFLIHHDIEPILRVQYKRLCQGELGKEKDAKRVMDHKGPVLERMNVFYAKLDDGSGVGCSLSTT